MKHPLHILNVLSLRVNISIAEPGIILPSSRGVECRRVQRFLLPGYLRPREFPLNFPFTFGPVTTTTVKPKCHQTITPRRQKKKCQALLRKPCLSISSNNRKQPRKHTKHFGFVASKLHDVWQPASPSRVRVSGAQARSRTTNRQRPSA